MENDYRYSKITLGRHACRKWPSKSPPHWPSQALAFAQQPSDPGVMANSVRKRRVRFPGLSQVRRDRRPSWFFLSFADHKQFLGGLFLRAQGPTNAVETARNLGIRFANATVECTRASDAEIDQNLPLEMPNAPALPAKPPIRPTPLAKPPIFPTPEASPPSFPRPPAKLPILPIPPTTLPTFPSPLARLPRQEFP